MAAHLSAATLKAMSRSAPAAAPVELDALKILAAYRNPVTGTGFGAAVPEGPEEPGLIEAGLRGIKQGATLDFGDEIEAGLRSAFSDRKYTEIRDEIRAKDRAAQEAHPWGFGLGQVLGGVATSAVTGGVGGAAAKLGAKGVVALAGAEGALAGAGASEADLTKGDVGGVVKDAAVGGATGAALGYGLHKVFGGYVDSAVERRARHLTEDIGEGGVPTVKKRLGQITKVNDQTEQSLAVNVLDSDKEFTRALKAGKKEALEVTSERLDALGKEVTPIYKALDRETGGVPLGRVVGLMDDAVVNSDVAGNSNVRHALEETRDEFLNVYRRRLDLEPGVDLNAVMIPTQDVRQWVTRLKKQATTSMGSLSETERKVVKDEIHRTADTILRDHLEGVATAVPELAPVVEQLREANRKIAVYASVKEALEKSAERKNWSPQNLRDLLGSTGLPLTAGVIGAGADVASGGLLFATTKAAQIAGSKLNKAATLALSKLVRAAKAGDVTKTMILDAHRAAIPMATVSAILNTAKNLPEELRDLPGTLADVATD